MLKKNQLMKQLKLPIEWIHCRHYQNCNAPLCPEDVNVKQCLWFPGEPVCRLKSAPEWVNKQRRINRTKGLDREGYFTVRMLDRIKEITTNLQGADSNQYQGERTWLAMQTRLGNPDDLKKPPPSKKPDEPGNYTLF